ncbi:hypothetical protein JCM33374_g5996 [Metschnikowia sp. JCM 33374]|nr:hypothetical protein JCM33374_g5996 [Metschnikowia sp. JCM 33374]
MAPRTAIIIYSFYQHTYKVVVAQKEGIESAGGSADIFQVQETLPESYILQLGGTKNDLPIANNDTLKAYGAFLFGIPTRFGNFPTQFKAFWDSTNELWDNGDLRGKPAGVFVSTGTLGGGQETTVISTLSTLVHHGMIFVPLGYAHPCQRRNDEVHGRSAWGAGTFAGFDGTREVSDLELDMARTQGAEFYNITKKF